MKTPRWRVLLVVAVALSVSICTPRVKGDPTVDLTTVGSSGYANGAYFLWVDQGSTGTGVIDSFVRMGTNQAIEQGYNTDGVVEFDTKDDPHTHSLLLGSVPTVQIGGIDYREFLLDIGEPGSASLLSLDTVEIYLADYPDLTGYPALGTQVFDLDVGPDGDAYVLLDSNLNSGNGFGDMFAYIPDSLFAGADDDDYVYLYSKFGESEGSLYPNSGSFEEWAVRIGDVTPPPPPPPPPPPVPAPAAVLLALVGSSAVITAYRRRKS